MGLKIARRLSAILSLASIRSKRGLRNKQGALNKAPRTNFYAFVLFMVVSSAVSYFLMARNGNDLLMVLLFTQIMVFYPTVMGFMSMVYSIMFEFNQSSTAASTDMINWMPISPGDYVLGSVMTTMYFNLPILGIFLGGTLGASVYTGMIGLWALGSSMGVLGSIIGAFTLEIVRSFMNRISGAFKGRGQSVMIIRTMLSVILVFMVSLIYQVTILSRVAAWFSTSVQGAWFIPFLWPSLTVLQYLTADTLWSILYAVLSIILTITVFSGSAKARSMNWVPASVSYKLKPVEFKPARRGILSLFGLSGAESAIIRKDVKSILRRKEILIQLLIPIFLGATVFLTQSGGFGEIQNLGLQIFLAGFTLMQVLFWSMFYSLMSMGYEGGAFVNLRNMPLTSRSITRAKIALVYIPTTTLLSLVIAASYQYSGDLMVTRGMLLLGFTGLMAITTVSMSIGVHYVDFTEIPRARYVRWQGRLLGMFTFFVLSVLILSPIMLALMKPELSLTPQIAMVPSALIAATIAILGYRRLQREVDQLYTSESL